jgi:hypothetical protein
MTDRDFGQCADFARQTFKAFHNLVVVILVFFSPSVNERNEDSANRSNDSDNDCGRRIHRSSTYAVRDSIGGKGFASMAACIACSLSAIFGEISTCIQSPLGAPDTVGFSYFCHAPLSHRQPRPYGTGM